MGIPKGSTPRRSIDRSRRRSFGVTLGLPGGDLLLLEDLPVVDSPLVEHLCAAGLADLGLGVLVRRVALHAAPEQKKGSFSMRTQGGWEAGGKGGVADEVRREWGARKTGTKRHGQPKKKLHKGAMVVCSMDVDSWEIIRTCTNGALFEHPTENWHNQH